MGINIFTEGQLKKITNGYKKSIGEGAFGKVYIGMTDDSQQVAVKCSTAKGDVLPQEEFVNEITFQFRISHTNLVRLVGCCLETDVPMLVFEFVPRGSLHSVLHGAGKTLPLSMPVRLDSAIGSAEALAYMHSHGGHNHVHGDIKSGNILLDDNLTPKVSDFESAKLVSVASRYSKWCVSGDMSYIEPIYIKSGRFTEKSDVYSFGVWALLELVTRKPAKYGYNSLYIDFTRSFKEEGHGRKLHDEEILSGDDARSHHQMECLDRISRLAVDDRPTMAEVVEKLKEVKAIASGGSSSVAS
ncbi:putative wall-associated receptor kinase-like 16 [Setaria viridis]|uniref:putative wall-associated receptor kinase-like 16 n=1 Tax=Setaria viridis TaxID=4556 RepID=UPI003B3ACA08